MENSSRKVKITSLTGLKVVAILLIFWHHGPLPHPGDMGARQIELLIIVSGFLTAYNYSGSGLRESGGEAWRFMTRHLVKFWPLHICILICYLILSGISGELFTESGLIKAILNLFLLQAWSPNTATSFAFNGSSWFLSAIVFCYFMAPFLLESARNCRHTLARFAFVAVIRFLLEYICRKYEGEFYCINFHTNPFVRSMEFYMGILLYNLFERTKEAFADRIVLCTAVELLSALTLCATFGFSENAVYTRISGIIASCFVVYAFSFNSGILSRIMSAKPFELLNRIQLEFFMVEETVMHIVKLLYNGNVYIQIGLMFVATTAVAAAYHIILAPPLTKLFKRILCNG